MTVGAASPAAGHVLGRDAELTQIDGWLRVGAKEEAEPVSPGRVLVIEGEPGIGKTTLWGAAVRRARLAGWQVLSWRPVPSDAGLPHVGLTDLLRPVPAAIFERLPAPQRRPLEVALLREEAGEGDLEPRAVGTGLAALLAALAAEGPLLLAVDDVQWLDPASARSLAFALRRTEHRRVRLVAAVRIEAPAWKRPGRAPGERPGGRLASRAGGVAMIEAALGGQAVSRLPVGSLSVASTHQMFRQVLGASFPRPVLVRIAPGGWWQPVLCAGDRPGGPARRRCAAWAAIARSCQSPRSGVAAVAQAAPRHQGRPGGYLRHAQRLRERPEP